MDRHHQRRRAPEAWRRPWRARRRPARWPARPAATPGLCHDSYSSGLGSGSWRTAIGGAERRRRAARGGGRRRRPGRGPPPRAPARPEDRGRPCRPAPGASTARAVTATAWAGQSGVPPSPASLRPVPDFWTDRRGRRHRRHRVPGPGRAGRARQPGRRARARPTSADYDLTVARGRPAVRRPPARPGHPPGRPRRRHRRQPGPPGRPLPRQPADGHLRHRRGPPAGDAQDGGRRHHLLVPRDHAGALQRGLAVAGLPGGDQRPLRHRQAGPAGAAPGQPRAVRAERHLPDPDEPLRTRATSSTRPCPT